jgi:hypothetical protein
MRRGGKDSEADQIRRAMSCGRGGVLENDVANRDMDCANVFRKSGVTICELCAGCSTSIAIVAEDGCW